MADSKVQIPANLGTANSKEIEVTYSILSAAAGVSGFNAGMTITFEKYEQPATYSAAAVDAGNGDIYFGKTSSSLTADNIKWRCFAYSTDNGENWQKYTEGTTNLSDLGATDCYFILDTYVSTLGGINYCKNRTVTNGVYYNTNTDVPSGIYANDYYYSEIRTLINNSIESENYLNINTNSTIYKYNFNRKQCNNIS